MSVVVIGAGFGGLAASIRLAAAGHQVALLERNPMVGGKVADLEEAGYRFDLGPTMLTLPGLYDELLQLGGTSLADEIDLVRLDPQIRHHWPNRSTLEIRDDHAATVAAVEQFAPGAGLQWQRFLDHAAELWGAAEQTLLAGPAGWSRPMVGRLDGRRTLAKATSSLLDDPRLQQLANRYAATAWSSPYQAPATLACLAHTQQQFGCWYPIGGMMRLREALLRTASSMGVSVRTGVDVGRIDVERGAVTGVTLADGGAVGADVVVSDVDAAHLYVDLLPSPKPVRQLDRAGRSSSAFLLCAAVRGRTEGIAHHNVLFPLHDRQEYRYLEAGQLPIDQTIAATVSSITDPGQAPPDCENWYVLVQVPPETGIDRKLMTAGILNRLAERGFDLRQRIEFTRTLLPADFDARYRAPGGAIAGTSSNGKRAARARPGNVGPVEGLYLVGGSTNPGSGLPFVAAGAHIVADLVADRHG